MLALCMRTDKPESELYLYDSDQEVGKLIWKAHRELAETIHAKIDELLGQKGKELTDIDKVIVYEGPGSFTGLRIGISVANSLAYGLGVPVVGARGDEWIKGGLIQQSEDTPIQPHYGQEPHITQQKK